MMRARAALPLVPLLAATWLAATGVAQQPTQQPTFRSIVDLVQVDVVAVDKDGNPVRGLKAGDFTLFDRKKPQTIAAFEEVSPEHASPRTASAPAWPPTVKRDVASNQDAQSDRLVVLVVDDLHIYKNRTDRTKAIARTVVNDLGPKASMAVLFTSGEHSLEVTQDRAELNAAIDQLKGRRPFPRPILAYDNLHGKSPDAVIGIQEFYDDMNTYKTLQDAARMLGAGDLRRKAFVFVSEGIGKDLSGLFGAMAPPGDVPEGGAAYAATGDASTMIVPAGPAYHAIALVDMMDAMRRSNVATYAIDPRGHVSSQEVMRECLPSGDIIIDPCLGGDLPDWKSWVRQAQHGLEITAQASGGFAITNTDDFTTGLSHVIDDLDHYYLLGFYPVDPGGKGYRQLDVKVNRPDVTLRFRHGYVAGGPPLPPKNKDPLVALSAGVMPQTDLPLRLTATPLPSNPSGRGETRVAIVLEVTASHRDLVRPDGSLGASLRYSVLAARLKDGKIVKQVTNTAQLTSQGPQSPTTGDTIALQLPVEFTLAPGRYQLRASATSDTLAKGGSVYLALEVPDFADSPIAVSGLRLGYADGARVPVAGRTSGVGPITGAPLPFAPSLDREFVPADTLRLYFETAAHNPTVTLGVSVEVLDANGRVVKTFSPPADRGRVDLLVRLADLPAGAYVLRATVRDPVHTAGREIGFIVRPRGTS